MAIQRTHPLQAKLNRQLNKSEGAEKAEAGKAESAEKAPSASGDGFDGVRASRNVGAGLQVAALQARIQGEGSSDFDKKLADLRGRESIAQDLKADKPGTAEAVAKGLSSKHSFADYGAAELIQEHPSKFAGHEASIAAAGSQKAAEALRVMADAGNAEAGAQLDGLAARAPEGYSGDRLRAAAGVDPRAWQQAKAAKAAGHEPLTAGELRTSVSVDNGARGPAVKALGDKAGAGHPQAVSALATNAAGDAPGVRDHRAKEAIANDAADALTARGGAKHLSADDAEQILRGHGDASDRVLFAAAEAGNPHVVKGAREAAASTLSYSHGAKDSDRAAAAIAKNPDATRDDFQLALKTAGNPAWTAAKSGDYELKEEGAARAAISAALKSGNANARAAVEEGLGAESFRESGAAHEAARAAPEQISPAGVKVLADKAATEKHPREELETLEAIGAQRTPGGAAARAALGELAKSNPRAREALDHARVASAPAEARPLQALKSERGNLTADTADGLVRGFDQLSPAQRREAIDNLKGRIEGDHPETHALRALGELAPHLSADDVKALASSTPRMPQLADKHAEKYYTSHVQAAKNGYRFDTERMTAKRDALQAVLEKGGTPEARDAAFDGLVDHKYDQMPASTARALADHAGATGDVERGLKLQDRVPGTKVVYPPDAHREVPMSDARAREVLADPDKWALLDGHNGARAQGSISLDDVKRAAADPALPPDVRAAARHLSSSGTFRTVAGANQRLERRDVTGFGEKSAGFRYDAEGTSYDYKVSHQGGKTTTTRDYQLGRQVIDAQRFSSHETSRRVEEGVKTRDGFRREALHETVTKPTSANGDVEGSNFVHGIFFSDSPQDLRDELKGRVSKEVTTVRSEPRYGAKSTSSTERWYTQNSRGEVDREVVKIEKPGAQNHWVAKSRNADGSYDTQSFIQGTSDTVLTRHSTKDGWRLTSSEARMDDTRAAVEKANESGKGIPVPPARTSTVEGARDDATVKALDAKLGELGLTDARGHKAYQEFVAKMGNEPFSVAFEKTTDSDGNAQSVLVAEGKGGRIAIAADPATGGVASQADLGDRLALQSTTVNGRHYNYKVLATEDGFEGFVAEGGADFKKSPELTSELNAARDVLGHTKTALDRTKDAVKVGSRVGRRASTALRGVIDKAASSPRFGKFTVGLDKGIVGISMVSGVLAIGEMTDGIMKGDAKQVAQGATGLAVDASNAIFGVSDLLQRTGRVSSTSSKLASTLRFSKWLGVAGGVAQGAFAVNDLAGGEYFKGTVGLIGGGATIMTAVGGYAGTAAAAGTVWSSFGWMGPVGAITALAATGLLAGYGHVESTKIAEPEIF